MKLCIPESILEPHGVFLGKTGSGKSSAMRHLVEWLLTQKQRLCILDPKGDWYGLKFSADGKSAGHNIVLFGDFKEPDVTDIKINDRSGKYIAELVASGNRPCVIGMRGWSNAAQHRFYIDFAQTLFNSRLTSGLKIFMDEAQNFAPKELLGIGLEKECLYWSKKFLSEGRGLGLTVIAASLRSAQVHNSFLSQCETLFAMRVIHPSDRKALKDWIEGNGDKEIGQTVLDSLAALKRSEAYVWSPEVEFGPVRVQFPFFTTFDSFAPPQQQKKISAKTWDDVDLEDVKQKLAVVIEEQKSNDPAELRKEIKRLKSENLDLSQEAKKHQIFSFSESDLDAIFEAKRLFELLNADGEKRMVEVRRIYELLNGISTKVAIATKSISASPQRARSTTPVSLTAKRALAGRQPMPPINSGESVKLPKAEAAILRVLANFPEGKSKREVGVIAGYAHGGGGFNNAVGALRSRGFVHPGEPLRITDDGLAAHGPVQPLPTGDELFDYWMAHPDLGKAEREILRVLVKEAQGGSWSKEEIAPLTLSDRGTPYESNGGGFNNAIGKLRTFELIEGKGAIKAASSFFE